MAGCAGRTGSSDPPRASQPPSEERPDGDPDPGVVALRTGDLARDRAIVGRIGDARVRVEAALQLDPRFPRLRALAAALALEDGDPEASAHHRTHLETHPQWMRFVDTWEQQYDSTRRRALAATRSLREALGDEPDLLWLEARLLRRLHDDGALLALADHPRVSDVMRDAMHGWVLEQLFFRASAAPPPRRPSPEVLALAVHRSAANGTLARFQAASGFLDLNRPAQARPIVTRERRARPDALAWLALEARVQVALADGDPMIRAAAIRRLAAAVHGEITDVEGVEVLADTLDGLGASEQAGSVRDGVRRRFPDARIVERWDWHQTGAWGALTACRMGERSGTSPDPSEVAKLRAPVDAFFDRPRIHDPQLRAAAAAALIEFAACDPTVPRERLERIATVLLEGRPFGGRTDAEAAILLTERGGDPHLARRLARRGLERHPDWSEGIELSLPTSDLEQERRMALALASDAVGFVHLQAGRDRDAGEMLTRALELAPAHPQIALHAATLAERRGQPRQAERILARAAVGDSPGPRACRARLKDLVLARGGKERDVSRTIAKLRGEHEREVRKHALDDRLDPREDIPPLDLPLHGGGRITPDDLHGSVTLLIVTEPWCTGCRLEMPALRELHRAYRRRKDVRFLVISADPAGIEALHAESDLRLPIAAGENWVVEAGISGYPTHIFLDRCGRASFRNHGDSDLIITAPTRLDALLRERPGC